MQNCRDHGDRNSVEKSSSNDSHRTERYNSLRTPWDNRIPNVNQALDKKNFFIKLIKHSLSSWWSWKYYFLTLIGD